VQFGCATNTTMFMQTWKPHVLPRAYCWVQNVVWYLSCRHLSFGYPPSILTTYKSKAINRNIRMLMNNYCARRKRSKIKWRRNLLVKNGHDISPIMGKSVASYWICRSWEVTVPDLIVISRNWKGYPMVNRVEWYG
jgi:hypothetical protein